MKKNILFLGFLIAFTIVFSCKKDPDTPSGNKILIGETIKDTVSYTEASVSSIITELAGNQIKQHGHCWSVSENPTIDGNHTNLGTLTQPKTITSNLDSLTDNTHYYVRLYLKTDYQVIYGDQQSFTTLKAGKPTVYSSEVTDITLYSAVCGGSVVADSGFAVKKAGLCWDTVAEFSITDCLDTTINLDTLGSFTYKLEDLSEGHNYFIKAYATNAKGTGYGETKIFSTVAIIKPEVSTDEVNEITATQALVSGTVINAGNGTVTQRGFCWDSQPNPTLENSMGYSAAGSGLGEFSSTISGLTENTNYYVAAYATNEKGTAYGIVKEFTTMEIVLPELSTVNATNITMYSATSGGNITSSGYGNISARGVCWSTDSNPTIEDNHTGDGSGDGVYESNITGLAPITQYYVRAYAVNEKGIAYGNEISFTTLSDIILPSVITNEITEISQNNAVGGGEVISDGGGSVSARGICWGTNTNPTLSNTHTQDGEGIGEFISNLNTLVQNTTYYVRAYATNNEGTAYGNQVSFNTLADPELPTVTTDAATNITQTTANSGGNVTSDGGADVTARGVCWSSTNNYPEINDPHTSNGTGTGTFTSLLTDLTPNTLYYVRAYATNNVGVTYGNTQSFMTLDTQTIPTVTTAEAMNITQTEATTGGTVHANGGANVTTRGVCYSTSPTPTLSDLHTTDGTGLGNFVSDLSNLTPNTQYYVRAYATNSEGTAYGNEITFITLSDVTLPTVTTNNTTNITQTTATSGGEVTDDGGADVTARGVCWSTSNDPTLSDNFTTDGNGTGTFTSSITGLTASTQYYVRAYATNSEGTTYGEEVSFSTLQNLALPSVNTDNVTNIAQTTATSGGEITDNGGAYVTARGVCWSTNNNPTLSDSYTTDGSGTGTFVSSLTDLTENTQYYVRAYATNSVGTSYGNEVSFTTLSPPWTCGDLLNYEGQDYETVLIGDQCWMAENLNVGVRINGVNNQTDNGQIEKYCYDNDESNCDVYGGLYQWDEMMSYTIVEGAQGICPNGWHVATDDEWKTLEGTVDSQYGVGDSEWDGWGERGFDVGNNLKSTEIWQNGIGIDFFGFTALPGGYTENESFNTMGSYGFWWTSSLYNSSSALRRDLRSDSDLSTRTMSFFSTGYSIRCIRD